MANYLKEVVCNCPKDKLISKTIKNAHPYGGNFEWDECTICKEKHNFKEMKRN